MSRPFRPLPGLLGRGRRAHWRRRVLRRLLSATLAATAVALVLLQLRPPPEPVSSVLVAARDLPGGAVLAATDLRVDQVPRSIIQPGALATTADAVGRRVGARLAAGRAHGIPAGSPQYARRAAAGRVPCTWCRPTPPPSTCSPGAVRPGLPGGRRRRPRGGGDGPRGDPADRGGPVGLTDGPPRGVVLALSADEADAVLAGHGSLEGPVTVTVVAALRADLLAERPGGGVVARRFGCLLGERAPRGWGFKGSSEAPPPPDSDNDPPPREEPP